MAQEPHQRSTPAARIYGIVAPAAPVAVLLRRGPSKDVQLVRWQLDTDRFEEGQWLEGRVYPERSALSPSGELFLYFAGKFKGRFPTFTAISRPPYFTALALWSEIGTWGGGGFFVSNRDIVVASSGHIAPEVGSVPPGIRVRHWSDAPQTHPNIFHGWRKRTKKWHPRSANTWLRRQKTHPPKDEAHGPFWDRHYQLQHGDELLPLGQLDWADWDHNGDLLSSKDGRGYRTTYSSGFTKETLVIDLSDRRFKSIHRRPETMRWPRR